MKKEIESKLYYTTNSNNTLNADKYKSKKSISIAREAYRTAALTSPCSFSITSKKTHRKIACLSSV